ncbi:hypothetical protein A3742_29775 [Oleiphilus sp. HI0071]|nr:hypothetical protein A3742_29775 [Oleiphilus sp. HI0071]
MAEDSGIQALAVHGRTRACAYRGEAEYDTIRAVKQAVSIPVFANGDITSPEKAKQVLNFTGADGLLIGRAAQGKPWIFEEIEHFLAKGTHLPPRATEEQKAIMLQHVSELHSFYGDVMGVRISRKHVAWYLQTRPDGKAFRKIFNTIDSTNEQLEAITSYFEQSLTQGEAAA